ncbi:MAG: hypothetical protein P4L41_11185 [Flavipsychrobacter sp.]|nr:hypothetical protein [Flavipsychrobacter sp.]
MSELLREVPVLALSTKIAIVDDNDDDARPIESELNQLSISNHYYNADPSNPQYPMHPLKDVEMVFMDLYFLENFGVQFDAYACVEWLRRIVPDGQKYILVVWSRDADNYTSDLLNAMADVDITMPYFTDSRKKQSYRKIDNSYDITRLLDDVGTKLREIPTASYHYFGQILDIDEQDDEVLINCLLDEEKNIFEVRRFDLHLFDSFMRPQTGRFIRIKVTNKPGSSTLDFLEENADLAEKFIKRDPEGLDDMDWPNIPEDDEDNI